jgi:hypothetical protein
MFTAMLNIFKQYIKVFKIKRVKEAEKMNWSHC